MSSNDAGAAATEVRSVAAIQGVFLPAFMVHHVFAALAR
jgi:hypothetical protein